MFSYVTKVALLVCVFKNTSFRGEWRTYLEVSWTMVLLPRIMESADSVKEDIKMVRKATHFLLRHAELCLPNGGCYVEQ